MDYNERMAAPYVSVDDETKNAMARDKIKAIKALRDWFYATTGMYLGLKDAKEMVEAIYCHAPQADVSGAMAKMRQQVREMERILEGE